MSGVRLPFAIALCLLLVAASANAALVRTDLLGGLGEFEFAADTSWQMATDTGWPVGVAPATPDDSVAAGWYRLTGYGVTPQQDTIYRIEPGKGLKGSNCQYMALKGAGGNGKSICLLAHFGIYDDKPFELHHGDQLTFRVARLFMSGYNVPSGAWVKYRLKISCWVPEGTNSSASIDLAPTGTPFAAEVSAPVVPGAATVSVQVEVSTGGSMGTVTPGIYVDGARLYRKSGGSASYDTEQVPAPRNRAVNSHMIFFCAHEHDPYQTAANYDAVMLQCEYDYPYALRLKYYNPGIRVFLYEQGGGVVDWRDQARLDPAYSNCPFGFSTVLAQHLDWLYAWPPDYIPLVDDREPWLRDINCMFMPGSPRIYYAHLDNPEYQQRWRAAVADKVARYHLDGVFADSVESVLDNSQTAVARSPAEVQSFAHAVYPYLRQSGVQTVMNCCAGILSEPPASIYFYPWWRTDRTFTPSLGYVDNTPSDTPDTFFQEWAFLKHWTINGADSNVYNLDYWDSTLENMDAVAKWNKSLPNGLKKSMFALADGVDRPDDPAAGLDGWAHFALCSFLLAQHQHAWFGACYVNKSSDPVDVDLGVTVRLGAVASGRGMLASDKSLQMRLYKNGLVIVNGHPTEYRSYRIRARIIDENGNLFPKGTTINLKPHTGRMFFYK